METENLSNLLCPCCNSKLEYTHSDTYQDLSDHVSDPNGEPSLKSAFQCPNTECIAHQRSVAWIENGEFFIIDRLDSVSWLSLMASLSTGPTKGYAINSWNYHYALGKYKTEQRTRKFNIGKYLIEIEPKTKGYDCPLNEQYLPKKFGWNFKFWKETEEGSYQHITPIHSMVIFYLQAFNSAYNTALLTDSTLTHRNNVKDALEYAFGYRWGIKDERIFAKIASFIIRKIYPLRIKTLLAFAKKQNIKYEN